MKLIPLTRGQSAIVDDDYYEELMKFKWYAWWNKYTRSYYAIRNARENGVVRGLRMHRCVTNALPGTCVDHINHNTLDQRKENLRICSSGQNNANARIRSDNTSGLKGVAWEKTRNKWRANLSINGKQKMIGRYATQAEAVAAYDKAASEHRGEFALTNEKLRELRAEQVT